MHNEWLDEEFVRRWDARDANEKERNPIRQEQLSMLTSILTDAYTQGKFIVDFGFGTGKVEEEIFSHIPSAKIIGIDASPVMIELAHERLTPFHDRYQAMLCDMTNLDSLTLPKSDVQFALSVQTLHYLPHEEKKKVFAFIHDLLEKGGTFLMIERFAVDSSNLFSVYESLWNRLENEHRSAEKKSFAEYVRRNATKKDHTATPEEYLTWLREAGFAPACIQLHSDRGLIAAKKIV